MADAVLDGAGLVLFVVNAQLLQDVLDQRVRVLIIINAEAAVVAQVLGLHAQNATEDAVEGAHLDVAGLGAHQLVNALAHFAGGLVREGER